MEAKFTHTLCPALVYVIPMQQVAVMGAVGILAAVITAMYHLVSQTPINPPIIIKAITTVAHHTRIAGAYIVTHYPVKG